MDPFEFATGLFAIVIGLAIGDMGMSLHKLLGCKGVRWGFRPAAAALLVAIVVSGMWFELWTLRNVDVVRSYFFYASLVLELFLVFLIAAAALPDEPEPGMDMVLAYEAVGRRLWTLFALYQFSFLAHGLYFFVTRAAFDPTDLASARFIWTFSRLAGVVVLASLLAIWPRNAWLHRLAIPSLIVQFLAVYSTASFR